MRRYLPEPLLQLLRLLRRRIYYLRDFLLGRRLKHPARPRLEPTAPVRLLIGPANFAGQGWTWARALESNLTGVSATSMSLDRPGLTFPSDYAVPVPVYRSLRWQKEQAAAVVSTYTHVLVEAMRPILGTLYGDDARRDIEWLQAKGLRVALVAHGSDIRLGSRHRELYPHSPWHDEEWEYGYRLEAQAQRLGSIAHAFDGPVFVTTPDLLDFAPGASWLPTVIDLTPWHTDAPALERERPVLLHVPSNPVLKGSHLADPVLQALHDEGAIEYRRLEGIPAVDMPAQIADADIVLDQLVLGAYGVMAVQSLAAGRVVIAHVHERVRSRLPVAVPVVDATVDDLGEVVRAIVTDRERYQKVAAEGPAYAQQVHDGRLASHVLAPWLGVEPR